MTREEAIANLKMISVAFVEPVTKEQRKLIDDTFDVAIEALEQEPKTGHWKRIGYDIYECSICSQNVMTGDICAYRYCHGCGARMESEES